MLQGRSAGGLLMGAVLNMAPHLFKACLAGALPALSLSSEGSLTPARCLALLVNSVHFHIELGPRLPGLRLPCCAASWMSSCFSLDFFEHLLPFLSCFFSLFISMQGTAAAARTQSVLVCRRALCGCRDHNAG